MSFTIHGNENPKSRFDRYYTRKTNRRYGAILNYVRAVLALNKPVTIRKLVPPLTTGQAINALIKLEHNKEAKIVRHGHGGRHNAKPTVYRAARLLEGAVVGRKADNADNSERR